MLAQHELDGPMLSFFQHLPLPDEDRDLLRKIIFVRKTYSAHCDIAKEGEAADRVFIVRSGWTALYRIFTNGERQIVDFPIRGDVIGLEAGKHGKRPSLLAVTDATVYETSASLLFSTVARSPRLTRLLLNEGARQRAILIEHLVGLGRRSALSRVAHLLLEFYVRLKAVGLAGAGGYDCPLTQYDLADALGLTAIHVNRMLRELRQSDLLHFHKGYVGILDEDELKALTEFEATYAVR